MAEWRIRKLDPGDADQVLRADVFDGPALQDSVTRFLGRPGAPDTRNLMLVAEVRGRIEGFVTAVLLDHPDKPLTLFINELGVNEAFQRQGIGLALLDAIRAEGRARGCGTTWVATEGDNHPALALYRAAKGEETPDIVMFTWEESPPG
ncbi:GNAT family N-acetyltransferase [Rhodobacter sp. SY28-1]|uniref:GNAT family N-acetyltransferase n=1 Tax=Rhodobacter sp. SY28-1 TaxID=2562317 RepID=UPI0010C07BDD|nr:GNAT family N-acetyltransferase [Rhodobacter sp. SY28-1]